MSYINWDHSLQLGHPQIDAEHLGVLSRINALVEIVFSEGRELPELRCGESRRACIESAVDALRAETAAHFQSEEGLMASVDFPGLKYHAEQHGELLTQLANFADHYHSTNADSLPHAVRFLREWFEFHVDTYDRALVRWLKTGDVTPPHLLDD